MSIANVLLRRSAMPQLASTTVRYKWSDHDRPLRKIGWKGKQTILTLIHKKQWLKLPQNQYKPIPGEEYLDPLYFEKQADAIDINDDKLIDKLIAIWTDMMTIRYDYALRRADRPMISNNHEDWLPTVDRSRPQVGYDMVKELKNAPEIVKKMFSIEYGTEQDLFDACEQKLINLVDGNPLNRDNIDVQIARLTANIRCRMYLRAKFALKTRAKVSKLVDSIKEAIDKRRELLNELRERDVERFKQVVDKLELVYYGVGTEPEKPVDMPERNIWVIDQLNRRLKVEKEKKLEAYRAQLEENKKAELDSIVARLAQIETEVADTQKEFDTATKELLGERQPAQEYRPTITEFEQLRTRHLYLNVHKAIEYNQRKTTL